METGLPYGDIIVIGAIAAFILLRYRAMLGEPRGRDDAAAPIKPSSERERVIQLPTARVMTLEKKLEDSTTAQYGALTETFVAMRGIDREFSPEEFIGGAKMAYEMLIVAFTRRDHDTLKMLLSSDMYKSFALSLADAEKEKRFTDTTLVTISKAAIKNAKLSGATATITVDFVSEQVHLIRDESGKILEGDVKQQNTVEDEWVFTRDLKNANPNWTIIET